MNDQLHRATHKLRFYLRHSLNRLIPAGRYRKKLTSTLREARQQLTEKDKERIQCYNKLTEPFHLTNPTSWKTFNHKGKSTYKADLYRVIKHFDPGLPFHYYFGDKIAVTPEPQFIKARPVDKDHIHSVLMRFESMRHFYFPPDPIPFRKKKNCALWRGTVSNNPYRKILVDRHSETPRCDISGTNRRKKKYEGSTAKISIPKQLENKFLISIEGNDVATNTKWIMNTNSLCFMPRPRRESWFMESRLIPGKHFVQLADDFSDLEEKIDYYSTNTGEAEGIVQNANEYCQPFKDLAREELLGILVAAKYFHLCLDNEFDDPGSIVS